MSQTLPSTITSQLLSHCPRISSFSLPPLILPHSYHLSAVWPQWLYPTSMLWPTSYLVSPCSQMPNSYSGEDRGWVLIAFPWLGALPRCLHSAAIPFYEMCRTLILPSPLCSQLWLKLLVRSKVVGDERNRQQRQTFFFLKKTRWK